MIELPDNVWSEEKSGSAGRDTPPLGILGVRPQQVAHWTVVRYFLLLSVLDSFFLELKNITFLSIERIWSRDVIDGERPPWTQRILLSITEPG